MRSISSSRGSGGFEDATGASIYIIEGADRALVVDTGMADNDFIGMVKSLTRLPFDLAVTHCHGDHMYHLDKFDRYYMNEKDLPLLDAPFMKGMLGDRTFNAELMPVKGRRHHRPRRRIRSGSLQPRRPHPGQRRLP